MWKEDYEQFFKDLDAFIKRWDNDKKCKCDNPECCHYRRAYNKTELPMKAEELFNTSLMMNIKSFQEVLK